MSVQILLEAVAKIREQAEAARAGRWFVAESSLTPEAKLIVADWQNGPRRVATCAGSLPEGNAANAEYIASWHPAVALAVADMIENVRCMMHCDDSGMRDPYCSLCEDSTCDHECPPAVECKHTVPFRHALAIAQIYLGRDE